MMKRSWKLKPVALAMAAVLLVPGCSTTGNANTKAQHGQTDAAYTVKSTQHGEASWYSVKTNRGTKTASGKPFANHGFTAAHKTLPFGTKVRVTNQRNGKSEIVTITDRGPFVRGRIIDVSIGSAERLGFAKRGVAPVKVEVLAKASGE